VTAETYIKFLARLGHKTAQTPSACWYSASRRVWDSFPYVDAIEPNPKEIRDLLMGHGFLVVRFTVHPGSPGLDSCQYVCDAKDYSLALLHSKARQHTRAALKSFQVRELAVDDLAEAGLDTHRDTHTRHSSHLNRGWEDEWITFCREAARTPGFSAWGAYSQTQLAAFLLFFQVGGCCHALVHRSRTEYLIEHVSNVLHFVAVQSLLQRDNVGAVSLGAEPLGRDLQGVGRFKEAMGFERRPIRERIVVHPALRPFLTSRLAGRFVDYAGRFIEQRAYKKLQGFLAVVRASAAPLDAGESGVLS
jgi:hypothetical protein